MLSFRSAGTFVPNPHSLQSVGLTAPAGPTATACLLFYLDKGGGALVAQQLLVCNDLLFPGIRMHAEEGGKIYMKEGTVQERRATPVQVYRVANIIFQTERGLDPIHC